MSAKPEEEREPCKVDTGDSLKVKQAMDEAAVKAILDMGYQEDHQWSNVKLLLMVVACVFAGVAQLYPKPFPESRPLLAVCCVSYFVCSALLQVVMSCIEQDVIMITRPKDSAALRVRTAFPRFQELYSLELEVVTGTAAARAARLPFELLPLLSMFVPVGGSKGAADEEKDGVVRLTVGKFFDVEGYFDEDGVVEEVTKAVAAAVSAANAGSKKKK